VWLTSEDSGAYGKDLKSSLARLVSLHLLPLQNIIDVYLSFPFLLFSFFLGISEVWLTSEDSGAYGKDLKSSLAELFSLLLPKVPEGRFLRVGMTNPPHILSQLDAM